MFANILKTEEVSAYDTIRNEYTDLGYSPTSEGLKIALHQEETDNINLGLQTAILDPALDMETKQALSSLSVTDDRKETSLPEKLGMELLMKPDEFAGVPSTDSQDEIRSLFIGSLANLVEYR